MTFIHVEETIVLDRPELHRHAESTFGARLDRAAGNRELQTSLVEDCPFWLWVARNCWNSILPTVGGTDCSDCRKSKIPHPRSATSSEGCGMLPIAGIAICQGFRHGQFSCV